MSVAPPLRRSEPHAPPVALLRPGEPILVTRLRHIGDVLLSLPLLSALRRALPESPIHYLADAGPLAAVVETTLKLISGELPKRR